MDTPDLDNAPAYTPEELIDWPRDRLDQLDSTRLAATSAHSIASCLDRLTIDECRTVLRRLSSERASDILAEMDEELAAEILAAMRETRAVEILDVFEPDDAADIVAELEDADRARLLDKMEDSSRRSIERLLRYDPDTAGGIMTTEQAIARLRDFAESHDNLNLIYVVDRRRRLKGIVSLRRLIQAQPEQALALIMDTDIDGVALANDDKEKVALLMAEHNLPAIAVVDDRGTLLGVVTHDDVLDIIQEEATEDIQKFVGAGGDESIHDEVSYSIRKRQPWLAVNLVTALAASGVVLLFEEKIGMLPIMAALMPIIAGIGGNSGQQSLAVAIRSIAVGDLKSGDESQVLLRQSMIGAVNGLAIGLLAGLLAWIVGGRPLFGIVVFVAMLLNIILGAVIGAFIPILFLRLRQDPAQCSSIFLTAITDTGGFFILLSLGSWLLI
jgi:magnesium transporter